MAGSGDGPPNSVDTHANRHFRPSRGEKSTNFILGRADQSKLRLAADIGDLVTLESPMKGMLTHYGSYFRSVNVRASHHAVELVLEPILAAAIPGSITELSLCSIKPGLLGSPPYLFRDTSPTQAAFALVMTSLRVLRLKNVLPRVVSGSLSNLTELMIQGITFGTDANLREFLWVLSTATQLQVLEIISLRANAPGRPIPHGSTSFSLPSLQTLVLEDLYLNVLWRVMSTIKPGIHRLILSLSKNSTLMLHPRPEGIDGIHRLKNAVRPHNIDTLVLNETWHREDPAESIQILLESMPTITTIYFDKQNLGRKTLVALTRPLRPKVDFPKLHQIYITRSSIEDKGDQSALRKILRSHPIEELVLGGDFGEVGGSGGLVDIAGPDERMISLKTWLRKYVPNHRLVGRTDQTGFAPREWKL